MSIPNPQNPILVVLTICEKANAEKEKMLSRDKKLRLFIRALKAQSAVMTEKPKVLYRNQRYGTFFIYCYSYTPSKQ